MNKEYLETLSDKIRYKKEHIGDNTYKLYLKKNDIEFLEKELQRLESIDKAKPSEALECLKIIGNCWLFGETDVKKAYSEQYNTMEQYILKAQEQEKALKIINEKNVDITSLKQALSVKQYNDFISFKIDYMDYMKLTQEEFDLLKEMLKCQR